MGDYNERMAQLWDTRVSTVRNLLILDVFTLARHGQLLVVWKCMPQEVVEKLMTAAPELPPQDVVTEELWTDHVPHWEDQLAPLTLLARAADPDFDSLVGYPDGAGAQSIDVLRSMVVGRYVRVTQWGWKVVEVERSANQPIDASDVVLLNDVPSLNTGVRPFDIHMVRWRGSRSK